VVAPWEECILSFPDIQVLKLFFDRLGLSDCLLLRNRNDQRGLIVSLVSLIHIVHPSRHNNVLLDNGK